MKVKTLSLILISFFAGLFIGCASQEPTQEQKLDQAQQQELSEIQDLSTAGEPDKAMAQILRFRELHKESIYYQASRLSEAKIYFDKQDYAKSLEVYQDILSLGPDKYPLIWAKVRYESTFVFEALGDDLKAITTLVGLENSPQLSEEVKFAELPARLAGLYSRQENEKEVLAYLDRADRGLKYLMGRTDLNREKSWLAETLYRMGKVNMTSMTEANIAQQLQSQRRLQIYLLRAMEQGAPLWSQKAADDLIQAYQKEWTLIQGKMEYTKELHQLISETMYRQPSNPELWNPALKNYYDFATKLETEVTQALFSGQNVTPVSEESLKLNNIKKNARVEATQTLPEEKIILKKLKSKAKPFKKDPNL